MKTLLLLCCVLCTTWAKPGGYFKQEYQFKKSSSTYQNNQLQTKNDDHGFYAKQGDLDGEVTPKVDQGNEHSEYVNPNVDGVGHAVTTYNDRDLTAEAERVFSNHQLGTDGLGGNAQGVRGLNGGHGAGSRSYSYSSSQRTSSQSADGGYRPVYVTQSNLGQVTQSLENNLSQQLHEAITKVHRDSSYSTQMRSDDIRLLENELKANLTRQLDEALNQRYGTQGKRGSFSYTISSSGTYSPNANYDNQELTDLKRQLEEKLLKELHDGVKTEYSQTSTYQKSSTYGGTSHYHPDSAEVEDLNRHPSHNRNHRPTYIPSEPLPSPVAPNYRPYQNSYRPSTIPLNTEDWTQKPQKVSYASAVEGSSHTMSSGMYHAPETPTYPSGYRSYPSTGQRQPYQTSYRPSTNSDNTEDEIQRPLKVTYASEVDGSSHGISSGSYHTPDTSTSGYRSYSSSNSYRNQYRPSYNDFPDTLAHTTTERIVINPSIRITDVVQNVQNDLSRQVNNALRTYEEKYSSSSYSLTGTRPEYQTALENFKRELKSNLTRQIREELDKNYGREETRGEYSFSSNSRTNANYRLDDLENLRTQAENNLLNHLENSFRQQENRYVQSSRTYQSSRRDYSHHGPTYTKSLTDHNAPSSGYVHRPGTVYVSPVTTHNSESSFSSTYNSGGSIGQPASANINYSPQLQDIKNTLQDDMNRQIQDAVRTQQSSYSSTSYNSHNNQGLSQDLTNELKRNLTKKLEETLRERYGNQGVRAGHSYTVSASGVYYPNSNYKTEDINALSQQLQDELVRKLNEQMNNHDSAYNQNQYSSTYNPSSYNTNGASSSSYSSSSRIHTKGHHPSSGYNMQSGSLQKYSHFGTQAQSGSSVPSVPGEDCMQGQLEFQSSNNQLENKPRNKRETSYIYLHSPQLAAQETEDYDDLNQKTEDAFANAGTRNYNNLNENRRYHSTPLMINSYHPLSRHYSQQRQNSNNFDDQFSHIQVGNHQTLKPVINQQTDDFGQKIEDLENLAQKTEDDFLNFDVENNHSENSRQTANAFGNIEIGSQYSQLGQKIEDIGQQEEDLNDLTQQTEDGFENFVIVSQSSSKPQVIQTIKPLYPEQSRNLQKVNKPNAYGQQSEELGQKLEELDELTQQTEDDYGKLEMVQNKPQSGQQIEELGQQIEDLDGLTQQTEDDFGILVIGQNKPHSGQHIEELGQKTEDFDEITQQTVDDFGKLEIGGNKLQTGQKIEELGQQIEDHDILNQNTNDDFEELQVGGGETTSKLTQQVENGLSQQSGEFSKPDVDNKKYDDLDLTQQTEDDFKIGNINSNSRDFTHRYPSQTAEGSTLYLKPITSYSSYFKPQTNQQIDEAMPLPETSVENYHPYRQASVNSYTPYRTLEIPKPLYLRTTTILPKPKIYYGQQEDLQTYLEENQNLYMPSSSQSQKHAGFMDQDDLFQQVEKDDLTQQQESIFPDAIPGNMGSYGPISQEQEPRAVPRVTGAISLAEAHSRYISRPQYANAPRDMDFTRNDQTTQQKQEEIFSSPHISSLDEFYDSINRPKYPYGSPQIDDQHPTLTGSASQSTYNNGYSYAFPKQTSATFEEADDLNLQQIEEQSALPVLHLPQSRTLNNQEPPTEKTTENTESEIVEVPEVVTEEEGEVTEIPAQQGFWKKLGGKINNSFNAAKQKAKGLAEKMNLG